MPNLIQKARTAIFYDVVDGKKMYAGGLSPHVEDERDFKLGIFGWGDYQPKHDDWRVPTKSVKNQFRNTCTMNSATVQKEIDENHLLNVMLHVQRMKQQGQVSGDGFSSLRGNQIVVQKFGIPEQEYMGEMIDNWEEYSKFKWNNDITANAYSHRSASFWSTKNKNEILKLLDEGKILATGAQWYNGWNMRGGFAAPWVIDKSSSYLVGGHAFTCVGYRKNYAGYGLCLRFQNSYGTGYGENGDFYMPIDYALKVCYTFYAQLDIEVDVGKFLQKYEGKFVKAKGNPAIYRIKDGKKEAFPNMTVYAAFGGARKGYEVVEETDLDAVPIGTMLDINMSPYWELIKNITQNMEELVKEVNAAMELENNS